MINMTQKDIKHIPFKFVYETKLIDNNRTQYMLVTVTFTSCKSKSLGIQQRATFLEFIFPRDFGLFHLGLIFEE